MLCLWHCISHIRTHYVDLDLIGTWWEKKIINWFLIDQLEKQQVGFVMDLETQISFVPDDFNCAWYD